MRKSLFAYGTLMDPDIMREVSGDVHRCRDARLDGYRRFAVRGATYPGIVPQDGSSVEGKLYDAIPDGAWTRLDRFEGEVYRRTSVAVTMADGTVHDAQTYVVAPEFFGILSKDAWNLGTFIKDGKDLFLREYGGFSK